MSVLYIQIRRNQITVRDLESKREVSGDAAFSNQRLLIANFFVAEKVLQDLVLQLHPRSTWHSFLPAKRMDIVVSALEMNEGGLSQVEERILHEVVAGATLMKYRQFHIHAQSVVLQRWFAPRQPCAAHSYLCPVYQHPYHGAYA
ncbi:YjaA family stress response protein [Escherichia coli]|uniref:YjaA family stress response protein n=4 Tax=Enterobacteriaceae TaxID=543 RepID=UPI001CC50133|nr:YjaA family stress response protein [Escherichia coli]